MLNLYGGPLRQQANDVVNAIRNSVDTWRRHGYPHVTSVTRELLDYWQREDERQRRLFFCTGQPIAL